MGVCAKACACAMLSQLLAVALLVALIPTGYLVFEYSLKPWGQDQLDKYADSIAAATSAAAGANTTTTLPPELGGGGAACIKCTGMNTIYPITSSSHPTYGSFQVVLMNNGGWFTAMLTSVGVAVGGGGSLLFTLLNLAHGVTSPPVHSATSSTAYNGAGLFEMVFLVSQAQFMTMLGMLHLDGVPRFFLEFAKKLAWTNLLIFPQETSYTPPQPQPTTTTRVLSDFSEAPPPNGVERYARLVGVEPNHLFYYTCIALTVALGAILVAYILLRVLIGVFNKDAAKTLDHRVIWCFLQLLVIAQFIIAMTSSFQIYYTATTPNRSMGDIGLAIVMLALLSLGLIVFGIVKVARHREEIATHGTTAYDAKKPFHLRYSVFYQDYTLENVYFFVAKMVLDIACGAIVGIVQSAPLQIGIMVALNAIYLLVLIWRKPYLVPLFYSVCLLSGYLRIVLLMLTLVQAYPNVFPQDARDWVASLIIGINIILLLCVLIRQFYALCVAIYKWASRPRPQGSDDVGIPLQERPKRSKKTAKTPAQDDDDEDDDVLPRSSSKQPKSSTTTRSSSSTRKSSSTTRKTRKDLVPPVTPPSDDTLFASQPYHTYTSGGETTDSTTRSSRSKRSASGGGRSLYRKYRSSTQRKEYQPPKDEQLPGWAQV